MVKKYESLSDSQQRNPLELGDLFRSAPALNKNRNLIRGVV